MLQLESMIDQVEKLEAPARQRMRLKEAREKELADEFQREYDSIPSGGMYVDHAKQKEWKTEENIQIDNTKDIESVVSNEEEDANDPKDNISITSDDSIKSRKRVSWILFFTFKISFHFNLILPAQNAN